MIRTVVALALVWLALWSDASLANLTWGVLLGGLLWWLAGRRLSERLMPNPWYASRALARVLASLVTSSFQVVRASVFPTPERTATSIVEIVLQSRSPLVLSLVANSITLTPGTMTVDCDVARGCLTVHVLGPIDRDDFNRQMLELERILLRAVGGKAAK